MPSPRPYSWQRAFDPKRALPPKTGRQPMFSGTARELAHYSIPQAPAGEYVFTQTRQLRMPHPMRGFKGRRLGKWLYYMRNQKQYVRAYTVPADPKSSYQVQQRMRMKQAQIGWWELTKEQNEAWDAFAATIPELAGDNGKPPTGVGFRAHRLYISAQLNRLAMGLPLRNDAPTARCARQIQGVELVAAPAPGQLAFRLTHGGGNAAGVRVLVEMTRAMPTDRRKPRENELTRAGITDTGSFFPLGECGTTYLLEQPRHAVTPGQRFGLRVTLVTEEGLRSPSLFLRELRWLEADGGLSQIEGKVTNITISHSHPSATTGEGALPSFDEITRRHSKLSDHMKAPPELSAAALAEAPMRQAQHEAFMEQIDQQMRELKQQRAEEWQAYKLQLANGPPGKGG